MHTARMCPVIYRIVDILPSRPALCQDCVSRQVPLFAVLLRHPSVLCSLSGVDGLGFQAVSHYYTGLEPQHYLFLFVCLFLTPFIYFHCEFKRRY